MAAPNMLSPTTINGKTATTALSTTSATVVLNNAASSGKLLRVIAVIAANVDGSAAADFTLALHSADDGAGTAFRIISTTSIPAETTLVVIGKDSPVYLEEDRSLVATSPLAGGDIEVLVVYEEIS